MLARVDHATLSRVRENTAALDRVAADFRDRIAPGLDQFRETAARISANLNAIQRVFEDFSRTWQPIFAETLLLNTAKLTLQKNGILPSATTPWNLYERERQDEFPGIVLRYYSENWAEVQRKLGEYAQEYDISPHTKLGYSEALTCHRNGLFRASILTTLACIESEFRTCFGIRTGSSATQLKELRDYASEAPAGIFLNHVAPITFFDILQRHLYEKVSTAADLDRFKADPIPNRHAAVHGLIVYNSRLSSLNMIFLADFIFFLISQLRRFALSQ